MTLAATRPFEQSINARQPGGAILVTPASSGLNVTDNLKTQAVTSSSRIPIRGAKEFALHFQAIISGGTPTTGAADIDADIYIDGKIIAANIPLVTALGFTSAGTFDSVAMAGSARAAKEIGVGTIGADFDLLLAADEIVLKLDVTTVSDATNATGTVAFVAKF